MVSTDEYLARVAHPGTSVTLRLLKAITRQSALTPKCADTPRLDGQVALVTGGNAGIGLHIAQGLAVRGAEVVIAARSEQAARGVASRIAGATGRQVHVVRVDLSDLGSVTHCIDALAGLLAGRLLQCYVQNAGVWPRRHALSAQGHEIAFATNVLGHFALTRGLLAGGLLAPAARIVIQTGDIYIMSRDCSPDFRYSGAYGGMLAYCRSKLGNLWCGRELQRRHPALEVLIAHPGVVASGLVAVGGGLGSAVRRSMLLAPEAGAQTALVLATQPGLGGGAYFHNTAGRMQLAADDPGNDTAGAARLWQVLEELSGAA